MKVWGLRKQNDIWWFICLIITFYRVLTFHFLICMSLDFVKTHGKDVLVGVEFQIKSGGDEGLWQHLYSKIFMEQFFQDDFSTVRLNLRIKLVWYCTNVEIQRFWSSLKSCKKPWMWNDLKVASIRFIHHSCPLLKSTSSNVPQCFYPACLRIGVLTLQVEWIRWGVIKMSGSLTSASLLTWCPEAFKCMRVCACVVCWVNMPESTISEWKYQSLSAGTANLPGVVCSVHTGQFLPAWITHL